MTESSDSAPPLPATPRGAPRGWGPRKWGALVAAMALIGGGYWLARDYLQIEYLANREEDLRRMQSDSPWLAAGAAMLIYITATGLSLPGAAVLSLAIGWLFGFWQGFLIVSFSATAGATVAFLLCRFLFRDWVEQRLGARFAVIKNQFEREGSRYLFTLRLIPIVPFFAINAAMGLTRIRTWTFWWVSQLGMIPGTAVYVYAGSTLPSLRALAERGVRGLLDWQLLLAFGLLAALPWILKRWVRPQLVEQASGENPTTPS